MRVLLGLAVAFLVLPISLGQAQTQIVTGGQTNALLDLDTLSTVGLNLTGTSPDVIAPGNLGPDSVAFGITPATDFTYTLFDLAPFSGSIQHEGSLFFDFNGVAD